MLDYERLDVYHCAITHLEFAFKTIPRLPCGFAALADQWRRAATSIPLNIAEAAGSHEGPERAHSYSVARGEAMECGAILDVVRRISRVPDAELDEAKEVIIRTVKMLSKLSK